MIRWGCLSCRVYQDPGNKVNWNYVIVLMKPFSSITPASDADQIAQNGPMVFVGNVKLDSKSRHSPVFGCSSKWWTDKRLFGWNIVVKQHNMSTYFWYRAWVARNVQSKKMYSCLILWRNRLRKKIRLSSTCYCASWPMGFQNGKLCPSRAKKRSTRLVPVEQGIGR